MDADKFLDGVKDLPALPSVAGQVMSIAHDEKKAFDEIVDIIQYDQGITANCLRICNSAFFGARQRISNLKDAVVRLGTKNIIKIVMASSVKDIFEKPQMGYGLRRGELWRHSVGAAVAADLFVKKAKEKRDHTLFTAALLHDIGKLVLDSYIDKDVMAVMEFREKGKTEVEAEIEVLGIDHATVGGLLAKRWQFPDVLVDAISRHHEAIYQEDKDALGALVRLSNLIANIACHKHDGLSCTIQDDVLEKFGLTAEHTMEVIAEFPSEMEKASELLRL